MSAPQPPAPEASPEASPEAALRTALGAPLAGTLGAALGEAGRARLAALLPQLPADRPPTLLAAMQLKRLLTAHLAPDAALEAYRGLLRAGPSLALRRLPVRPLLEAVTGSGTGADGLLHVFHPGGQPQTCRPPRFAGAGSAPEIRGTPRTVFAGRLRDVTLFGRSSAILQAGALLLDVQPGEAEGLPDELAFDPVILAREGETVLFLEDADPARERHLPRAWSLMGNNSVSFGHWMCEMLPRFLAAAELPEFRGVPVLIDAEMPPQHRQSLELFGAGRFPLVAVPRGQRLRVAELLVMSDWLYSPHLMLTDRGIDPAAFVPPMATTAALYARAGERVAGLLPGGGARGLFWARSGARHRAIANAAEVEALLARRGYARHLPERHDFATQIGLLRGADRIVLQNGSGMHGAFLARPGTRLCLLSHPALPFIALFAEMMRHLGMELEVLTGPFERQAETWLDQSDYRIDPGQLDRLLDGWEGARA